VRYWFSEVWDWTWDPTAGTWNTDPCILGYSNVMKEEELAFLKAHIAELPATALRQLRRDILQERRKKRAEASAKAKESGDRITVPRQETPANGPSSRRGQAQSNEVDFSDSGGSLELATRRPARGLKPGAGSAPLPTKAKGAAALAPEKSTGKQSASSGRQLSYAEVSKPSGTLKPTAKETGTAAAPAASSEAAPRRMSAGTSGSVSGPLCGSPEFTSFTAAQVEARPRPPPPRGATTNQPKG
jgi:hypothetical protein